ncbi:MAG TPA: hypothetical protein VKV15_27030 [Bryobacteraceae bacterium]|nr:hypothetical protein [Bryobacteraceae bacterium]
MNSSLMTELRSGASWLPVCSAALLLQAAPLNFPGHDVSITGGTGAYLGMRGQVSTTVPLPNALNPRSASVSEDPANRRSLGGGGIFRLWFHLVPMVRPAIVSVLHSDSTPVSASNPARRSETLILSASGLGPTRPGVDPEQPFPDSPRQEVNSPLEVTVNGSPADVVNKIGWPGTTDTYRLDIRVPDDTTAGLAALQVTAAFVAGPEVRVPVQ